VKRYNPKVYVWFRMKNGSRFVLNHIEYRLNDVNWKKVSNVVNGKEYGYVEVKEYIHARLPEMVVMGR